MSAPTPPTLAAMIAHMRERIETRALAAKYSERSDQARIERLQLIDAAILANLEAQQDDGK